MLGANRSEPMVTGPDTRTDGDNGDDGGDYFSFSEMARSFSEAHRRSRERGRRDRAAEKQGARPRPDKTTGREDRQGQSDRGLSRSGEHPSPDAEHRAMDRRFHR